LFFLFNTVHDYSSPSSKNFCLAILQVWYTDDDLDFFVVQWHSADTEF